MNGKTPHALLVAAFMIGAAVVAAPQHAAAKAKPAGMAPEAQASAAPTDDQELAVDDTDPKKAKRKRTRRKPDDAPAAAPISSHEPECAWTGKRVLSLLRRDDVDAAREFGRFYTAFGCPDAHLGKAFGCVAASEAADETFDARIDRCWSDPYTRNFQARTDKAKDADAKGADSRSAEPAKATEPKGDAGRNGARPAAAKDGNGKTGTETEKPPKASERR